MMELDDSDAGAQQAAPVWAVFGDLMSGLVGAVCSAMVTSDHHRFAGAGWAASDEGPALALV